HGGDGNDSIAVGGNYGYLSLTGDAGDDTLYAGVYSSTLDGGDGNDVFNNVSYWNAGNGDVLTGGAGSDTYHLVSIYQDCGCAAVGSDTITDFQPGVGGDVVDL